MINLRSKPPPALVSAIRREQALSVRRIDLIRMWGASGLLLLFGVLDLLLRREISELAADARRWFDAGLLARQGRGQREVGQLERTIGRDQHRARMQVLVHDAGPVQPS